MSILSYLSGPVIGGVIGYFTNYLAIKMLFRPLKPVYIGKFRLPFTPGIVPRRKDELAGILGDAIVAKFFNSDDLEVIFTSDYLRDAFADSLTDMLTRKESDLRKVFSEFSDQQGSKRTRERLEETLCVHIVAAVLRSDLSALISREGGRLARERLGAMGKLVDQETILAISVPLAQAIESHLLEHGRELIAPLLDEELQTLSQQPIQDLVNEIFGEDHLLLRQILGRLYDRFMNIYVRSIVGTIDVGGMITQKVQEMSAVEVESLVLDVVNRELKQIVWLGALLGGIIGALNIFI